MIDLKKRIEEAEASSRFDLRQQLVALQRRMRTNPLLRRLIDLREGTPLDESDIAAIQKEAGSLIVLVDWFYLPSYPDTSTGRLLLFTIKKEHAPTMDILPVKMEDVRTWINDYLRPEMYVR
jgi:hypothetical protein